MNAYDLVKAAERLLAARRARDAAFGEHSDGFGEPAWDMLLRLFIESEGRTLIPAEELIAAAHAPAATAGTYLKWLLSRDLISIEGGIVSLAPRGRRAMEAAVSSIEQLGRT